MIDVERVCKLLGCGTSTGYRIIRKLNQELRQDGKLTLRGHVPEAYLRERFGLD